MDSLPLVLIVCWIVFLGVRNAPLWKWFAITSGGSLLIAPHVYAYDGTMFMLPLWLILFQSGLRIARPLAAVFSAPLPFFAFLGPPPWSAIPAGLLHVIVIALVFEQEPVDSETNSLPEVEPYS